MKISTITNNIDKINTIISNNFDDIDNMYIVDLESSNTNNEEICKILSIRRKL